MDNKSYTILIIEDEFINAEFLKQVLRNLGFENIYLAESCDEATGISAQNSVDFAFVDINIKGSTDGIQCAKLINSKYNIPIIYTTAYADSNTINEASETNMFGYLIKPFDAKEVEVICKIVLKIVEKEKNNPQSTEDTIVQISDEYKFNLDTNIFTVNNKVIKLSKNESKLLEILCRHINQCVSYEQLKNYVWENKSIADSTMRDTISRLRRKAYNIQIESFSGVGYCLKKV